MAYLRLYLTVGLFCHGLSGALFDSWECFVMVYLRYLSVGVLCHGLSEGVSDSGSALSWSIWGFI